MKRYREWGTEGPNLLVGESMKSCGIVVEGMKKSEGDWNIQMDEVVRREEEGKKRKENLKKYRIKSEKKNGGRE